MQDRELFPSEARYVYIKTETHSTDLTNYDSLDPLEQVVVRHSVDRRRAEFGDTRWCAHQALKELGAENVGPIVKGERGMPLWPRGYTGSMTHTDGFRAAVAAPISSVRALGVDAEVAERLPEGVLEQIARAGEVSQIAELEKQTGLTCGDRLLFCAKEAVYKSWFPMTERWLDFDEAEVVLRTDGTFIAYLLVRPTPVPFIEGRWVQRDNYLIASTAVL